MEKKKALLVLAGGRAVPDVLALLCVQPQLVAIITSHEGWKDEETFKEIAQALPNQEEPFPTIKVKSYDLAEAMQSCTDVFITYPTTNWEWFFSIGSCPKIMGIAAYEVAKQKDIPCIYIDTQHEKIVSLVRDIDIDPHDLFHMSVSSYMKIFRREQKQLNQEIVQYRKKAESWGHLARIMALSPDAVAFIKMMRDKPSKVPVHFSDEALTASSFIQSLVELQVIEIGHDADEQKTCAFTSPHIARFLGKGDWLEVFVWHEAKSIEIADDCQWGYEIKSAATNELDVALTYKAQLIFAECKTDEEPFQNKTWYLDGINTKAEMLGRSYVTKLFITNASKTKDGKLRAGYNNFVEQAKLRSIVVVTAEDLPNIGEILKREALTPTFPRI